MPGIVEKAFSSGAAMAEAMVSGSAPARLALTWMVGKSTLGSSLTGSAQIAEDAENHQRRHQQRGHHRIFDKAPRDVHGALSSAAAACAAALARPAPRAGLAPSTSDGGARHQAQLAVRHHLSPGVEIALDRACSCRRRTAP